MSSSVESFPFAPLRSTDREMVTALCGGAPPTLDAFRTFLQISGLKSLPDTWYRRYLQDIGEGCVDALGVADETAALRDFNRGALFYAGTVAEVGALAPLPHDADVLRRINETHRRNLAVNAADAVGELGTFGALFDRFRGVFNRNSAYDGYSMARLGAGVLHMITAESAVVEPDPLAALEIGDPLARITADIAYADDMRDLRELFDGTVWPD